MKAFILDDEKHIADLVKEVFENKGVDVDVAYSYQDALRHIHKKYDILFVDHNLEEDKTGPEFINNYRKNYDDFKAVVFSGKNGKIPGVDKILYKTIGYDQINDTIDQLIKEVNMRSPTHAEVEKSEETGSCPACSGIKARLERGEKDVQKIWDAIEGIGKKFDKINYWIIGALGCFSLQCMSWTFKILLPHFFK